MEKQNIRVYQNSQSNEKRTPPEFETKAAADEYAAFMTAVESGNGDMDVISNMGIICYTLEEFEEYDEFVHNLAGYIAVLPLSNRVYYVDPEENSATSSLDLCLWPLFDFVMVRQMMDMLKVHHETHENIKFDKYDDTPKIVLKLKKIVGKEYFPEFKDTVREKFGISYDWKSEDEKELIELANQFEPKQLD